LRKHVKGVFDAVDSLLERRCDGFGDGLGIGAGIGRADDNCGRNNLGIFTDGEAAHREQSQEENDRRKDTGENRAAYEKGGEVHKTLVRGKRLRELDKLKELDGLHGYISKTG